MLTADTVLEIFEQLPKYEHPAAEAIHALADVAAQRTPSDAWNRLRAIDMAPYLAELTPWVKSVLVEGSPARKSVYFLLWNTELRPDVNGQDLYLHTADVRLDPKNYEDWEKIESEVRSHCSVFEWFAENMRTFEAVNGYSDYSIPLVFAGGAIFEAINTLCAKREIEEAKHLCFGVGYRWGDAFGLGEIGSTKIIPNVERVA